MHDQHGGGLVQVAEAAPLPPASTLRVTARALALGARLDASGLERPDTVSTTPLAFHVGSSGFVVLYRFGVAVLVGLSPLEEDDFIRQIKPRVSGERDRIDDESAVLEVSGDGEDRVPPGGPIGMKDLSPQRLLVVADALAKTVSLGRDEREVNGVLDVIEPFATGLSRTGRPPATRRNILKLIGQALLVQHRVAGPRRGRGKAGRALGPAGSRAALCPRRGRIRVAGANPNAQAQARRHRRDRPRHDRRDRSRSRDPARGDDRGCSSCSRSR